MAAHITLLEAQAWADGRKLVLTSVDNELEVSQTSQVFGSLSQVYDTSTWVDALTTPTLVRKIIAMLYVGWYFQRAYSEDADLSTYGLLLVAQAQKLLDGLIAGSIVLPITEAPAPLNNDRPSFYPTDASSALDPTVSDMSLGPAAFSMGQIW